ncbi:nucleolar complex protein 1 [Rhynchophorus ferrugineus]|uniref:nucleolar complex protein 1 n=1 Tax=Rhynchophorus ferrugineus TaxID=354439 RepID=UPI003FCCFB50
MKINKKKFAQNQNKNSNNSNSDDLDDNYQESPKWYEEIINEPNNVGSITEQVLIELKDEAKRCHDAEINNYNIKNSKTNSNYQWMKTVMNSGTVSDRIAAHTVAIQDNPICSLETLRNLVNMVKVGKKKECLTVMETLTELFLSDLLKPDMKLKPFHSRALVALNELSSGNAIKRRKILSLWYFEDQLKEIYNIFIQSLNKAAQDTVESNKEKAITAMFKLLCGNPEQEKILLANIINKLGDPSQKVVSKAIYCLSQLLFKHPNMQEVVLKEVEKLLFRPNISNKAQYYCLCFLSQFYFSHETQPVAKKVIELYLSFFKACIKKGDVDSRMMSALLMGINRAYPYSKIEFEDMAEHIDTLYRLVHLSSFNISIQVLMLLYHVTSEKMADRFYSALYRKLTDAKLFTTTHQAMLLSLLYKSLLKDNQVDRIKMFIKRLLQISLYVQPSFASGIFYLVSRLISKNTNLQAFVLKQTTSSKLNEFEDDEEKYYDIKDEKEEFEVETEKLETTDVASSGNVNIETVEIKEEPEDVKPDIAFKGSSWFHATDAQKYRGVSKYNPLARNPLYGGGNFLAYNELLLSQNYFHPTIALFAGKILKGESIDYTGDPLKDFTLIRFLDRFVFKNPKTLEDKNGAHPTFGKRKFYKPKGVKTIPVNSKSYLNEKEQNIPVDEMFLYSYLQRKYRNRDFKEADDNSDLESVQSEEFEDMLDKMTGVQDEGSDEDIDYMGDIGDSLKKKPEKGKKRKNADDEEESADEVSNEESDFEDDDGVEGESEDDLEANEEDLDLMDDLSDNDDEDIEFLSDSEDGDKSDKKNKKSIKKKGNKDDISALFASAEEFASLLEDEGSSKQKSGSSNVMQNKDKASQKQLAWEDKRNQWIKGFNKAVKPERGPRNPKLSKRKPNNQNKNKKFKK